MSLRIYINLKRGDDQSYVRNKKPFHLKSNHSETNIESLADSMVDQYLIPGTKRPLVGRVPVYEASPSVPGSPLVVPDIISGVAYQASPVVSGDGITAVNYGASDIAYGPGGPADNTATTSIVPGPVEVGPDGIPEGIVDITEIFESIELVPSPDRVTELAYFPKEEDPEWVPTFFEEIPEGIEVNIINEGEYGEWDLLPESYEIDPDIPMWR